MSNLEEIAVQRISTLQYHLCTVESCTGGLISHLITNVPGASKIFWGARVVYDDSAKRELGVAEALLKTYGAVSPEVARELAEIGLKKMETNLGRTQSYALIKPRGLICIATTGIAGPTGGSALKPVGLCYLGLAISKRETIVEKFVATGTDRIHIKAEFAQRALKLVCENT